MLLRVLPALVVLVVPAVASAGKFGGFSADGTRYLDGPSTVCAPAAVDGQGAVLAAPTCATEDAASIKTRRFSGPPRLKVARSAPGGVDLSLRVEGQTITVLGDAGAGRKPLAVVDAGAPVKKATGPYLSPDGTTVAIEYTVEGASKTAASSMAFDVRAPLAAVAPKPGGLVERLRKRSDTWTQAMVPCEEPGVTMVLGDDRRFTITVETRCEKSKDRFRVAGRYAGEEPDRLVLTLPNQDGPDEQLTCTVATCEGAGSLECIRCDLGDVGFVVRPAPPQETQAKGKGKPQKPTLSR